MEQAKIKLHQECLDSLNIPETRDRVQEVEDALDGTCSWLFEPEGQLAPWLGSEDGSRFLWLRGKPGSGKSVMMKHLQNSSQTRHLLHGSYTGDWQIIPYFFHDRGKSEAQKSLVGFLHCVLYSLATQREDILECLCLRYLRDVKPRSSSKWTLTDLRSAFWKDLTTLLGASLRICLFIDAIDEQSIQKTELIKMFQAIDTVQLQLQTRIKIIFSSRPDNDLVYAFGSTPCIEIVQGTSQDIALFIDMRLDDLQSAADISRSDVDKVAVALKRKAGGSFMWLRLVIDDLDYRAQNGGRLQDMLKAVDETASGDLVALYRRCLERSVERCRSDLVDEHRREAIHMLSIMLDDSFSGNALLLMMYVNLLNENGSNANEWVQEFFEEAKDDEFLKSFQDSVGKNFPRNLFSVEATTSLDTVRKYRKIRFPIVRLQQSTKSGIRKRINNRSGGLLEVLISAPLQVQFIHQSVKETLKSEQSRNWREWLHGTGSQPPKEPGSLLLCRAFIKAQSLLEMDICDLSWPYYFCRAEQEAPSLYFEEMNSLLTSAIQPSFWLDLLIFQDAQGPSSLIVDSSCQGPVDRNLQYFGYWKWALSTCISEVRRRAENFRRRAESYEEWAAKLALDAKHAYEVRKWVLSARADSSLTYQPLISAGFGRTVAMRRWTRAMLFFAKTGNLHEFKGVYVAALLLQFATAYKQDKFVSRWLDFSVSRKCEHALIFMDFVLQHWVETLASIRMDDWLEISAITDCSRDYWHTGHKEVLMTRCREKAENLRMCSEAFGTLHAMTLGFDDACEIYRLSMVRTTLNRIHDIFRLVLYEAWKDDNGQRSHAWHRTCFMAAHGLLTGMLQYASQSQSGRSACFVSDFLKHVLSMTGSHAEWLTGSLVSQYVSRIVSPHLEYSFVAGVGDSLQSLLDLVVEAYFRSDTNKTPNILDADTQRRSAQKRLAFSLAEDNPIFQMLRANGIEHTQPFLEMQEQLQALQEEMAPSAPQDIPEWDIAINSEDEPSDGSDDPDQEFFTDSDEQG